MIKCYYFGRQSFSRGLQIQNLMHERVHSKQNETHLMCLVEHSPVYTVGLRDTEYTPEKELELKNLGADFQRIRRGGLITFHGPGQLVVYPIFDLRKTKVNKGTVGVRRYVELIEEVIIQLAHLDFKINNVGRTSDPGVWINGERKLAAVGVRVQNGITGHGFALNCDTDMRWFDHIVPCGLEGKTVTSLTKELGHQVTISDVLNPLVQKVGELFEMDCQLQEDVAEYLPSDRYN